MKAKDYYRRLKDTGGDQEKVEETLVNILTELSAEANDILSRKPCKSAKEKMDAINGVILKWKRIIELKDEDTSPEAANLKFFKLNDLGFIASFVELYPEHGDVFDLESFKKELLAQDAARQEAARNMPVALTPLEKVTKETMTMELMMSYHNMKSAYDMFCVAGGMTHVELADHVQPLIRRIGILNKWIADGDVNYDDIETFVAENEDVGQLKMNDICIFIQNKISSESNLSEATFRVDGKDTLFMTSLREATVNQFRDMIAEDSELDIQFFISDNEPIIGVQAKFKDCEDRVYTNGIKLPFEINKNTD